MRTKCVLPAVSKWLATTGLLLGGVAAYSQTQSDPAAVQAMQNVIAQAGGATSWAGIHSDEEAFSVVKAGDQQPHVMRFLDDWSQDMIRYRRRVQGQTSSPQDHNGSTTFQVSNGREEVSVPEFDRARVLAVRLPAAAAVAMLNRPEYVLKVSKTKFCEVGTICIDVYRFQSSALSPLPEQQWVISTTTWQPTTVRYLAIGVGSPRGTWEQVRFLSYAQQGQLTIPVSIEVSFAGTTQTWTFSSITENPEFNTAKFDAEVLQ